MTKKTVLETRKLEEEIRSIKKWWRVPLLQMLPSVLLIGTTVYFAFENNVLELKKERLDIETRQLEDKRKEDAKQVKNLDEVIEKLKADIESKKSEMEVLKIVEGIQRELLLLPGSSFSINQSGFYELQLTKPDLFTDDHNCDIDVLKAINQITAVQSVIIEGFVIGKRELELIAELEDLKYLELRSNSITDEHLELLSKCSGIQFLVLNKQNVSTLKGLSTMKLKLIRLEDCPLTSEGFLHLENSMDSLEVVNLISTPAITDEVIPFLRSCKNILEVRFGDTKVSGDGIDQLMKNDSVHIEINQGQLEEYVKNKGSDRLSTVTKESAFISPFSALVDRWELYQSRSPKFLFRNPNEK